MPLQAGTGEPALHMSPSARCTHGRCSENGESTHFPIFIPSQMSALICSGKAALNKDVPREVLKSNFHCIFNPLGCTYRRQEIPLGLAPESSVF